MMLVFIPFGKDKAGVKDGFVVTDGHAMLQAGSAIHAGWEFIKIVTKYFFFLDKKLPLIY